MTKIGADELPEFAREAFYCPHCGGFAKQDWQGVTNQTGLGISRHIVYMLTHHQYLSTARCHRCGEQSVWLVGDKEKRMIHPESKEVPLSKDASPAVRQLYEEALRIASRSPRAAAALLRLALETLCKELLEAQGKRSENMKLKNMIDEISATNGFAQDAINTMHTSILREEVLEAMNNVRDIGNKAVHEAEIEPGKIQLEEKINPTVLFWLIRYIVDQAITVHKEAKRMNMLARQADGVTENTEGKEEQQ